MKKLLIVFLDLAKYLKNKFVLVVVQETFLENNFPKLSQFPKKRYPVRKNQIIKILKKVMVVKKENIKSKNRTEEMKYIIKLFFEKDFLNI